MLNARAKAGGVQSCGAHPLQLDGVRPQLFPVAVAPDLLEHLHKPHTKLLLYSTTTIIGKDAGSHITLSKEESKKLSHVSKRGDHKIAFPYSVLLFIVV